MSMGIVSDSELELEMERLNGNTKLTGIVENYGKGTNAGRTPGHTETPEVIRKIIGENAIEEGNEATKILTRALGVSDDSLAAYKNGATSSATYNSPVPSLRAHLDKVKERIIRKSSGRINQALDMIDEEKLKSSSAKELSSIAKDLSGVIKNMEPEPDRTNGEINQNTQFVVYAPRVITSENKFPIIHVEE